MSDDLAPFDKLDRLRASASRVQGQADGRARENVADIHRRAQGQARHEVMVRSGAVVGIAALVLTGALTLRSGARADVTTYGSEAPATAPVETTVPPPAPAPAPGETTTVATTPASPARPTTSGPTVRPVSTVTAVVPTTGRPTTSTTADGLPPDNDSTRCTGFAPTVVELTTTPDGTRYVELRLTNNTRAACWIPPMTSVELDDAAGKPVTHASMPLQPTRTHVFLKPGEYSKIFLKSLGFVKEGCGPTTHATTVRMSYPGLFDIRASLGLDVCDNEAAQVSISRLVGPLNTYDEVPIWYAQ